MKRILPIILAAYILTPSVVIFADDSSSSTTTAPTGTIQAEVKDQEDAANTAINAYESAGAAEKRQHLVLAGDKVVVARQAALTALLKRVNSGTCKDISSDVKAVITADIQAISANLTTQKTTIDKDTSLDGDKSEVKSVYTGNRIFVRFVPAIHGICASEKIIELVTGTKITVGLAELKTGGIDTTAISTDLSSAKTSAQAALTLFEKIAANPGDGNTTAVTDLKTAIQDLNAARKSLSDAKTLIDQAIDTLKSESSTSN